MASWRSAGGLLSQGSVVSYHFQFPATRIRLCPQQVARCSAVVTQSQPSTAAGWKNAGLLSSSKAEQASCTYLLPYLALSSTHRAASEAENAPRSRKIAVACLDSCMRRDNGRWQTHSKCVSCMHVVRATEGQPKTAAALSICSASVQMLQTVQLVWSTEPPGPTAWRGKPKYGSLLGSSGHVHKPPGAQQGQGKGQCERPIDSPGPTSPHPLLRDLPAPRSPACVFSVVLATMHPVGRF